jgi:predicted tellurium resistance membrane protein TerC
MIELAIYLPDFSSPEVWISIITLTFLEVVLGIDNIIFISIVTSKLPEKKQPSARFIGLLLAMLFRVGLLFGITYLIGMTKPLFAFHAEYFQGSFTGQSLILIAGGMFLLYKSTTEIHHKLEGGGDFESKTPKAASFGAIILQIVLIDAVFSFDSILTAVGLTKNVFIMIVAVVVAIIIMMIFANPIGNFVNKHPTIQMLALAFLILIGFMLIAEGAHVAHVEVAGSSIGAIPKGYIYFAIAFSLGVEMLNMRLRKNKPVQLYGISESAIEKGILKSKSEE